MPRQNLFVILILIISGLINLLAAFGPELGFDALWYHLTIPKLYLSNGGIYHLPGGLLYYSEMPRLAEILYLPLIKFFSEVGPHLLNWASGIGISFFIYKISRKYLDQFWSLIAVAIFYVNPLVGWLSGSAYIDLFRTFWEVLAIYLLLNKKIFWSAVAVGLAVSAKTLAIGTLAIFLIILFTQKRKLRYILIYLFLAIIIALPWFLSAFLNTGYPFFPIGAGILDANHTILPQLLHPWSFVSDFWKLSLLPEDPISPIFFIILPFVILTLKKYSPRARVLIYFSFLGYLIWWLIPRLGGGRYLLPYLPVWSILTALTISQVPAKINKRLLILTVYLICFVNLGYRLGANSKLIPYFLGKESKEKYLCQNLDLKFQVFVDCDGFFAQEIHDSDLVYVAGTHNLFYLNFPFVDETWYRGEKFTYLLIQNRELVSVKNRPPIKKYLSNKTLHLVYTNPQLSLKLYRL